MTAKKTKIKFDIERHREARDKLKIHRALREFESKGLLRSRVNEIGQVVWQMTELGRREENNWVAMVFPN